MAKPNRKQVENTATQQDTATQPETAVAQVPVINVKVGLKYRGARDNWYKRLLEFNGKPLAEFIASVEADRPSVYGAKSTHAGQPEPVPGWVQFFRRNGVFTEA